MVPTNASSDKPYRLRFEHRPDYLHVHIQSEHMELETAKKLVREAAEELKKAGNTRILAEIDVEKRLSRADRYWVISEFPELGYTRYKIALLYPDTDRPDEYDFSETVMANRGVQAMAFTSVVDAERWLAGDRSFNCIDDRGPFTSCLFSALFAVKYLTCRRCGLW